MQVFWMRHGTRNFTTGDVPLNEIGLQQAQAIAKESRFRSLGTILSSPRKRAQMTVAPLADKLQLDIKIVEDLDQMQSHESEEEFISRIRKVLEKISQNSWNSSSLLLCTHSDWLSTACRIVPTDALDLDYKMFQCAEVLEFKISDGLWSVKER